MCKISDISIKDYDEDTLNFSRDYTSPGETNLYYITYTIGDYLGDDERLYILKYNDEFYMTDGVSVDVYYSLESLFEMAEKNQIKTFQKPKHLYLRGAFII